MKLFLGPVSINTIDATIEFAENNNIELGLIPSRRQIDYDGGYVGDFNSQSFSKYVKDRTSKVKIFRDHGGESQGKSIKEDTFMSFYTDCTHFDFIHLDPFLKYKDINTAAQKTSEYLKFCDFVNPSIRYEVGTEQALREISTDELEEFILILNKSLTVEQFSKVKYLVIQCGTKLKNGKNIGAYDKNKLKDMLAVAKRYGLISKEHNGDYQEANIIKEKFNLGLDCINIAPELGVIESSTIIEELNPNSMSILFQQCLNSGKWKKWVSDDFDPHKNKIELIKICGHYIYSSEEFKQFKKQNLSDVIDFTVKNKIKNKIAEIIL
jgi:fructose/tagatose bisphosphate aldolase